MSAPSFVGRVKDLIPLARRSSPEELAEKIGTHVLVGPAAVLAGGESRDASDGWTFETKMTGSSTSAMLSEAFVDHEVHALRKARAAFFRNVIMVGRASSNDVILESASISKLHARLRPTDDGRFVLSDAGSTHGTFVGDARLAEDEERAVGHGDHLRFGDRAFKLFETERLHRILIRTVLVDA